MKEECRKKIRGLAGKKYAYFTKRCNESINIALKMASGKNLLIQEEGGWLSYEKLGLKNGYKITRLKQKNGKIIDLDKYSDSVLLMHSMPGYAYKEDMKKILETCKKNNIFLINDCCGSIGTSDAKQGDIIVCSFGKHKPLSAGGGGFIALNKKSELLEQKDISIEYGVLHDSINSLNSRLMKWEKISEKIKKDLHGVMNPGTQGINVFVSLENQKEKLLKYCEDNKFEYTTCPRYIRTMSEAISIEVKRI